MRVSDVVAREDGCLLVSGSERGAIGRWAEDLSEWLAPRGVPVHWVRSGPHAIEVVEGGRAQVAVVATNLPRMDGLSLLRIIRSIDGQLPCLLVSPNPDRHLLQQALRLEAYSVLAEPIDRNVLVDSMVRIYRKFYDREFPAE